MYRTIEEMCDEIRMQVRKETAASLWNEGIRDVELIARSTKLSSEKVREVMGIQSEFCRPNHFIKENQKQ